MGTKLNKPQVQGILVPSDRIALDTLDAAASSFSQADPGPGQALSSLPSSKLTAELSGGQEQAIELLVRRSGMPEIGRFGVGLGMQWRLGTETADDDWRGKNSANVPHAWFGVADGIWDRFDLAVAPVSQSLLVVYAQRGQIQAITGRWFDVDAGAWSAPVSVSVNPDAAGGLDNKDWAWMATTGLPDDRLLVVAQTPGEDFDTYVSNDRGRTWTKYAAARPGNTAFGDLAKVVYFRGQLALFSAREGQTLIQQASRDLATSWDEVTPSTAVSVDAIAADGLPNQGGIVLGTLDSSDQRIRVRMLQSAYQPYSDATAVLVVDEAMADLMLAVDGAGVIWVWGRTVAEPDEVQVYVSYDGGQSFRDRLTWDTTSPRFPLAYNSGNAALFPRKLAGRFCRGDLVVAHNSTQPASPALAGWLGTIVASGWSNLVFTREGFGGTDTSLLLYQTGIPIELPVNVSADWSNGGATAPTIEAPGELSFAGTASTASFVQLDPAGANGSPITAGWSYRIAAGSFTDATRRQAAASIRIGGAHELDLRFLDDRTVVWDVLAGVSRGEILLDNTQWHDWIASVSATGAVRVAWRAPLDSRWQILEAQLSAGAPGATNRFAFGIFDAEVPTNTRSRHWFVAERFFDDWIVRGRADVLGGPVTTAGRPIPGVGSETRAAFLSASRGPGVRNEQVTVEPFYTYGVDNLFPATSPSPGRPWRSADTSEQTFVFDVRSSTGQQDRLGAIWHHGVALIGCNFRQAVVEYTRDGSLWLPANAAGTTPTWDAAAGFVDLAYTREGHGGLVTTAWLRPSASTSPGARPLARNELVGGHAVIAGVAYPITANSPGVWAAEVAVGDAEGPVSVIAEVRIEGTPPANGLVTLVWPSAVLWNRAINGNPGALNFLFPGFAQAVRLRIPADQPTVGGFYQIGALLLGSTLVLGKRSSRGWSQAMEPNVARRVSRTGTIRKRQLGPNRRRWTWNWGDGVLQKYARDGGTPDFLQLGPNAVSGAALAMRDDVWTALWGLLDELEGGALPVLAAAALPLGGDGIQTDRTLFLYATVDSAVQFSQVEGDEGLGEFGRIEPLQLTEIV